MMPGRYGERSGPRTRSRSSFARWQKVNSDGDRIGDFFVADPGWIVIPNESGQLSEVIPVAHQLGQGLDRLIQGNIG